MTKEFLTHPIVSSLENHSNLLNEIMKMNDSIITKFNQRKSIGKKDSLTKENLEIMEVTLYKCLCRVGQLAKSRDSIQDELSDHYNRTYKNSPAMGKKLYLNHRDSLYKPYDKIKDNIWKSLTLVGNHKDKYFK